MKAASLVAGVVLLVAAGALLAFAMIAIVPIPDVEMSQDTWLGAAILLAAGLITSAMADALIIAGLRHNRGDRGAETGWKVMCPICGERLSVRWKIRLGYRIARHLAAKHDYANPLTTLDEDRNYATIKRAGEIAKLAERGRWIG